MSDEYDCVARGKLKLKTDSEKKKKKKDKKKDKQKLERGAQQMSEEFLESRYAEPAAPASKMTKAELAFKKGQEKMVRITIWKCCSNADD